MVNAIHVAFEGPDPLTIMCTQTAAAVIQTDLCIVVWFFLFNQGAVTLFFMLVDGWWFPVRPEISNYRVSSQFFSG
jgi:hypothetical protein